VGHLVKALFIYILAASTASAGIIPSQVPNIGLGVSGPATSAPSAASAFLAIPPGRTVFTIHAGDAAASATNGNFYPFYKDGVAFQAGANGTLCFNITLVAGTANTGAQLVSATASFAFNASSLTGGVYQMGASGKTGFLMAATANTGFRFIQPGVYKFGANTYGGFQAQNSASLAMSMDCYDL